MLLYCSPTPNHYSCPYPYTDPYPGPYPVPDPYPYLDPYPDPYLDPHQYPDPDPDPYPRPRRREALPPRPSADRGSFRVPRGTDHAVRSLPRLQYIPCHILFYHQPRPTR